MALLITLWYINAVVGIGLSAMLIAFRRRFSLRRWLSDGEDVQASASPSVSVVIAARNEERAVERTLREFATLPGVAEVIIVDDGSEDKTLQIARAVAVQDSRVRVLEAPPLSHGWIGKTHAIHWASKYAGADYILFTDADVHLHELPLQEIVSRMGLDAVDHVGGNFRLAQPCISEAVTAPVLASIAFLALGLSATRSGSATGAFNLVRESAYRQMNGHLPIRDHLVDDVALARCMKSHGYESRFLDLSPVLSVRLFRGFRGFAGAVARSAIPFLGSHPFTALLLSLIGVMLSFALLLMPVALTLSFTQWTPANAFSSIGGVGLILSGYIASTLPFVLSGWLHCRSPWWGLASPLGLSIMTTAVAIAALRCMCGFTVRWRGRSYPHAGRNSVSHERRNGK